jgi:uncharacterized protein (UPF0548 family)
MNGANARRKRSMLSLRRPSESILRDQLTQQSDAQFSYEAVGASRGEPPLGYAVAHRRDRLGEGAAAFELACQAIRTWKMFDLGWVELCWPNAPIALDTTVGVLIRAGGLWWLSCARIVYVLDEVEPTAEIRRRFGFAYGTLPDHAERGEERFCVEWHTDGSVWYDLFSFSQPRHWLATLGGPVTRRLQYRFGTDSLAAMQRAVQVSQGDFKPCHS